jgi:hypothetical protein
MNTLLRFSQAKEGRLKEVANACTSSEDFRTLLNEATAALMRRGDWDGVVVPMGICLRDDCITWPRYVGACGNSRYPISDSDR